MIKAFSVTHNKKRKMNETALSVKLKKLTLAKLKNSRLMLSQSLTITNEN